VSVCSLSGAFSVSFIELSGGLFYFPFLWSLMGIVSLTLCFDFSSKFLFSFLMCWLFLCYFEVRTSFIAINVVVRSEAPLFLVKFLWTIILNYIHFGFQNLQRQQPWRRVLGEILSWDTSQTSSEQLMKYPQFQECSTDWVLLQHFLF
jgi:hypothetical protein